jgi:hypothetical protein
MLLIIGFFELARLFDEVPRQFDERRSHIELRRLASEFHAFFGLIAIFLRGWHAPNVTVLRPRHGENRPDAYPFPSHIRKQT